MVGLFRRNRSHKISAVLLKQRKGRGFVHAVGESNYQKELLAIVKRHGGPQPDGVKIEVHAALVPEPDNKHDPNAISIQLEGKKVAYLSRDDAEDYQEVVQHLARRKQFGACRAFIMGGAKGKPSYGIFLDLADADDVLDGLDD
jgi:hypothetical protein